LVGYSFSGKRTQAKLLSESFPLKSYSIDELISKSLEILERLETPIEAHPKFKSLKKNQIDQMIEEKIKKKFDVF
jgi:adenylate kinase family enzyme